MCWPASWSTNRFQRLDFLPWSITSKDIIVEPKGKNKLNDGLAAMSLEVDHGNQSTPRGVGHVSGQRGSWPAGETLSSFSN